MAGAVFFFILFLKAKSRIRDHGGEIAQIRGIFRLILSEENFMSMSEKEKREGWQGLSLTLSSQLLDGSTLSSWVESLHRSWCKDERLTYTTTAVKNSPVYKRSRRWLHVWWFFTSFDGSRENELVALDVGWQVVVGGIVYCILSTFVVNVFFLPLLSLKKGNRSIAQLLRSWMRVTRVRFHSHLFHPTLDMHNWERERERVKCQQQQW